MYDIITLGSANIDLFVKTKSKPEVRKHFQHTDIAYHLGDKLIVEDLEITTGGGGTNTAVAFSRLGLKTGCICALGKDPNGQYILNELKKEKVVFLGKIKEGNTGLSIILPGAKDRTILAYKGVNNFLRINDINLQKITAKWLYVSSMLGQSLETSEKIIQIAKKKGSKIALNLSQYLANQGLNKLSNMLSSADVIFLNRDEAQILTGKKRISDMFHSIYNYTTAIVVITSGSGDIYASDSLKNYIKKVHPINPVDTTGAGDAFASGFIYGLMKSANIHYAMECGHEEALSVLKYVGAKNNLLRKI